MIRRKKITVYLFGGIGNQLFQYFAGLALSQLTRRTLVLRPIGTFQSNRYGQYEGISNFNLNGNYNKSIFPNFLQEKFVRRFFSFASKYKLGKILSRFGIYSESDYYSSLTEFDKHRNIRLFGYFQNPNFFEQSIRGLPQTQILLIKRPSEWYLEMEKLVKEERPIIIHIRRGDYLQYVNTIGVLTLSYYQQALELISQDTESKYWIFSDCLETSNDFALFANLPREDTRIINPPKKSTDSESLRLMSLGRAIVISNSTFSWWAARFSDRDAEVVAPATWYRNLESPKDFHLSNWKVSPSIWFDDSQIS